MIDPLEEILTFAERSYIRQESEQLIAECLERRDTGPFFRLLEDLVLAGSTSLSVLWEVLGVIRTFKAELGQQGIDVRADLMQAMSEFGVHFPELVAASPPEAFRQICSRELRKRVQDMADALELDDEALLEEICVEAGNKVAAIAGRLAILSQLENNVLDWIDGLAYEAMHRLPDDWGQPSTRTSH
ncbi:MAG: hypothetical protein P1P76_03320 [Anaerolineales bacterium]|nr:hypothetical protein [Anaerolineales bacterium]